MVECKICGKKMKWIQNTHLKKHNMTLEEYKKLFPDAETMKDDMVQHLKETRWKAPLKKCDLPECNNMINHKQKYCSYTCAGKAKARSKIHPFSKFCTVEGNPGYVDGDYRRRKTQKRKAFERDKGICQRCGKQMGEYRSYGVHHIIPRRLFEDKKEADDLKNLITLCGSCHHKVEFEFADNLFFLYMKRDFKEIDELIEYLKETIIKGGNE